MSTTTPVTTFTEVNDTVARLVETVRDEQWSAPTPCTDWNVQQLGHGWDLARAIGQKALFDDATVEREIEFAQGLMAELPSGPGAPFAPSRTAPEDAPALDRLAALLGRDITR